MGVSVPGNFSPVNGYITKTRNNLHSKRLVGDLEISLFCILPLECSPAEFRAEKFPAPKIRRNHLKLTQKPAAPFWKKRGLFKGEQKSMFSEHKKKTHVFHMPHVTCRWGMSTQSLGEPQKLCWIFQTWSCHQIFRSLIPILRFNIASSTPLIPNVHIVYGKLCTKNGGICFFDKVIFYFLSFKHQATKRPNPIAMLPALRYIKDFFMEFTDSKKIPDSRPLGTDPR